VRQRNMEMFRLYERPLSNVDYFTKIRYALRSD
jgi:hypothetical protein